MTWASYFFHYGIQPIYMYSPFDIAIHNQDSSDVRVVNQSKNNKIQHTRNPQPNHQHNYPTAIN